MAFPVTRMCCQECFWHDLRAMCASFPWCALFALHALRALRALRSLRSLHALRWLRALCSLHASRAPSNPQTSRRILGVPDAPRHAPRNHSQPE